MVLHVQMWACGIPFVTHLSDEISNVDVSSVRQTSPCMSEEDLALPERLMRIGRDGELVRAECRAVRTMTDLALDRSENPCAGRASEIYTGMDTLATTILTTGPTATAFTIWSRDSYSGNWISHVFLLIENSEQHNWGWS